MARRPRYDGPGTWHHVTNRGVARRPLFEDRADQRFFLARLARQVRMGRIEVHAFCLMTTHFHLLLYSPIGELSEAMRRLQNEHSRHFNRKRKRDGTLIRGRFFSKPVRSLSYRCTLVAYIDSNPVKAGIVKTSGEYEMGSARAYVMPEGPRWLARGWVESEACSIANTSQFSPDAYRVAFGKGVSGEAAELVHARNSSMQVEDPLDDLIGSTSSHMREWMQRKALLADGCTIGLPVCSSPAVQNAIEASLLKAGPWLVQDGTVVRPGAKLARAGLLRDLCGLHWHAIAGTIELTEAKARVLVKHHRRLLVNDTDYSTRSARVAREALLQCTHQRPGKRSTRLSQNNAFSR